MRSSVSPATARLVDPPLRARHAAPARVPLRRLIERASEGFERRLEEVMRVATGELADVKRALRTLGEGGEEIRHQRRVERADDPRLRCQVAGEERPAAQVERDGHQALVHRYL